MQVVLPISRKRICLLQEYLSSHARGSVYTRGPMQEVLSHARGSVIWCKRFYGPRRELTCPMQGVLSPDHCTSNGLSLEILCKGFCHARGSVSISCKVPTHDSMQEVLYLKCTSRAQRSGSCKGFYPSHARVSVSRAAHPSVSCKGFCLSAARVSVMQEVLSLEWISRKWFCHLVQEYLSPARVSVIWCKRICLLQEVLSIWCKGFCHLLQGTYP